jgi:hypothetical protein
MSSFRPILKIRYALLLIWKELTTDGWIDVMFNIQDACGDISIVFFVLLFLTGSFGVLQLIVAVLTSSFQELYKQQFKNTLKKEIVGTI